jgi:hypothetical protein
MERRGARETQCGGEYLSQARVADARLDEALRRRLAVAGRVEHAGGGVAVAQIAAHVFQAALTDLANDVVVVRAVAEDGSIVEPHVVERIERDEPHVIGRGAPGEIEQLLNEPGRRDQCGALIEDKAVGPAGATRLGIEPEVKPWVGPFQDYGVARREKSNRGGHTGEVGPECDYLPVPEKGHVHVRTEARVVGEIPAHVVRVIVNHDLVRVPVPVAAVADIVWRDAEIKAGEPESARAAAGQPPPMVRAKASGKVAVLPRAVEVVVRIVGSRVVTNPVIVRRIDVRRRRMARTISDALGRVIVRVIGWTIGWMIVRVGGWRGVVVGVRGGGAHVAGRRCRTLCGRVTAAYFGVIATARGMVSGSVLRVRGEHGDRQCRDYSNCKTIG